MLKPFDFITRIKKNYYYVKGYKRKSGSSKLIISEVYLNNNGLHFSVNYGLLQFESGYPSFVTIVPSLFPDDSIIEEELLKTATSINASTSVLIETKETKEDANFEPRSSYDTEYYTLESYYSWQELLEYHQPFVDNALSTIINDVDSHSTIERLLLSFSSSSLSPSEFLPLLLCRYFNKVFIKYKRTHFKKAKKYTEIATSTDIKELKKSLIKYYRKLYSNPKIDELYYSLLFAIEFDNIV